MPGLVATQFLQHLGKVRPAEVGKSKDELKDLYTSISDVRVDEDYIGLRMYLELCILEKKHENLTTLW